MNNIKTNSNKVFFDKKSRYKKYKYQRQQHWNKIAHESDSRRRFSGYYHNRIQQIYKNLIPIGSRVLELGCAQGDLLASMMPSEGVGIDFSDEMLRRAREKHPHLQFKCSDIHELVPYNHSFDFIILSDLINDTWDVQTVFEKLNPICSRHTRIILNTYSRLWELPLSFVKKLNLAQPELDQNWLTVPDLNNLLYLSGFETIRTWAEILLPLNFPLVSPVLNRILVRFWPFYHLALTNFIVAKKRPEQRHDSKKFSVSIVIPARNEAGNISQIYDSMPEFPSDVELIFVEGHSKDNTFQVIEENIADHSNVKSKLIKQTGVGKGNAVREGFEFAKGDILMILDSDLTVPFNYLPSFYEAISKGSGELINGVRLVYPMEEKSMRFINLIGNKFFSILFSWILGQPIKDTLCGTKVLWRSDYKRISQNRKFFGDFDPFGDFDLLLGAAKLNLKIIDIPIRYQERSYGSTNIQRWRHGWLLIKMALFAIRKLKFQ